MQSAAPLGRLLVTSGLLTQQALDEVLAFQKIDGRRLGELLAEKGLVRPHQLAQFLSHQLACPWVSLQRVEITKEAIDKLPPDLARRHHMVPVHLRTQRGKTALYVAMDDPTDDVALSEAAAAATMPVRPMIALPSEIMEHLERFYPSPPPPPVVVAPPPPPVPVIPIGSFPPVPPKTNPSMSRPPTLSRPPPPLPISKNSLVPSPAPAPVITVRDDSSVLDIAELIEDAPPESQSSLGPSVLLVDASSQLLANVRAAAERLDANAMGVPLAEAGKIARGTLPCAIVVGEETYANARTGVDRLALDTNALLIVSNDAFAGAQLEGLLRGAVERWRSSTYEKGAVLEGRYELLRDIGGRMRPRRVATWEVRHLKTARRSIIKIGSRGADSGVVREQAALARMHHPGVLELRDAGNTDLGEPYIVVESVEGKTLEGLVAARGNLEKSEAYALVHQVAVILVAAHEAGVRHGDLRPEHVVVVRDAWGAERVKLVGWETATTSDGPADPALDLAGIRACAAVASADVDRALATATSMQAIAQLTNAPEATKVLDANPVMRGASMRPPAAPPPAEAPKEMRRHRRAPYRTPVRLTVMGIETIDGRCEDISAGGLFVVTRGHIKDRAQISVRFALPIDGKVISEMAVVKWSRAPNAKDDADAVCGVGIELISPGAETVRQIARYVLHLAERPT